jgi:hypothetical protein
MIASTTYLPTIYTYLQQHRSPPSLIGRKLHVFDGRRSRCEGAEDEWIDAGGERRLGCVVCVVCVGGVLDGD